MKRIIQIVFLFCSFLFLGSLSTEASTNFGDILSSHQIILKHLSVHEDASNQKTYILPIKRIQNLIVIEATVDSVSGNFVFDTGASYLVLNQTYFRKYRSIGRVESGGVMGSTQAYRTFVPQFQLQQLNYNKIEADVADLSSIENSKKVKILGLLGIQLFKDYAVAIDLFKNQLYIFELDRKGMRSEEQNRFRNSYLKTNFSLTDHAILLDVRIADRNFRLAFDTGAEVNLLDYHLPRKVMKTLYPINRITLGGVGQDKIEALYARLDSMKIDTRTFMNNRFLVTNMQHMSKYYEENISGVLGYDFYSRGIFLINFVRKEFEMYTKQEEGGL